MTKILAAALIVLLIIFSGVSGIASAAPQPAIELEGAQIEPNAYIDGENVYLPLRAIVEALGYRVLWTGRDNSVSVTKTGQNILLDLKNGTVSANDHTYYMGSITHKGATYLEADFFSENLSLGVKWAEPSEKVELEKIKENGISVKTVREASEDKNIKITIQYPQINGLDDQAVQDNINAVFKESAQAAYNEGLKNAGALEAEKAAGYDNPNKYETYFDYRLKYNQNSLLSVVFLNYQYTGGAHGLTVQSSHTFNLETGAEYSLKDLFPGGEDYISLFNETVKSEIKDRELYVLTPFESIKANQDFYLVNDAAVVYFQQYEYFPYAAGIQEFAVHISNRTTTDFN